MGAQPARQRRDVVRALVELRVARWVQRRLDAGGIAGALRRKPERHDLHPELVRLVGVHAVARPVLRVGGDELRNQILIIRPPALHQHRLDGFPCANELARQPGALHHLLNAPDDVLIAGSIHRGRRDELPDGATGQAARCRGRAAALQPRNSIESRSGSTQLCADGDEGFLRLMSNRIGQLSNALNCPIRGDDVAAGGGLRQNCNCKTGATPCPRAGRSLRSAQDYMARSWTAADDARSGTRTTLL